MAQYELVWQGRGWIVEPRLSLLTETSFASVVFPYRSNMQRVFPSETTDANEVSVNNDTLGSTNQPQPCHTSSY